MTTWDRSDYRVLKALHLPRGVRQAVVGALPVALSTALFVPLRSLFAKGQWGLCYLLVVVFVAGVAGAPAALAAAALSFLAWNFFFIPPYGTFRVHDPQDLLTLLVFFVVAAVLGVRTAGLHEREERARANAAEAMLLHRVSARLLALSSVDSMVRLVFESLREGLPGCASAFFLKDAEGGLGVLWDGTPPEAPSRVLQGARRACAEVRRHGESVRLAELPVTAVYLPLHSAEEVFGVLYVACPGSDDPGPLPASLASLAATFLEKRRLEERAMQVEALKEADRVKSSFFSSVSHELKTPVAAIKATITGLLDEGAAASPGRVRDELVAIEADVTRLEADIGDLLDLSRLEAGAWPLTCESYGIGEVVGGVLAALPKPQRDRIRLDIAEDLPPVRIDFRQMARALSNMVANALSYSPPGEPVLVGARASRGSLSLTVEDRGPGVPPGEREAIFGKFYRGSSSSRAAGSGLGLAVTREVVAAHGGRVSVEDAEPRGSRFVVTLPLSTREDR